MNKADALAQKKARLALLMKQKRGAPKAKTVQITAVTKAEVANQLSFAQQRLWFLDHIGQGSVEYNIPAAFAVRGAFDVTIANRVMTTITERHHVLRSTYRETDEGPLVQRQDNRDFEFVVDDLRGHQCPNEAVQQLIDTDVGTPFNLAQDAMVRGGYIHLDPQDDSDQGVLLFNIHHIASDGWSMGVLVKEFVSLYQAFTAGKPNPLPDMTIQYADYAHWQQQHLNGPALDNQRKFWRKQLADVPSVHALIPDRPRQAVKGHEGLVVSGLIDTVLTEQLKVLAKQQGMTVFMILHAALALLLSKHSHSDDIVIGVPMANRRQLELAPLMGCFINTQVLRTNTTHETLSEYLSHVREVNLDAQSHQDVPFEQLVEMCQLPRSTAHSPLVQVMFAMNTAESGELTLDNLRLTPIEQSKVNVQFDLNITAAQTEQGIVFNWVYDVALYDGQRVEQWHKHLHQLLGSMADTMVGKATSSDTKLADVVMLADDEVEQLVHSLNDTCVDYDKTMLMHQLIGAQAQVSCDHIALVFEQQSLTYQQLDQQANQLAHYLVEQGVCPDTPVGLLMTRSIEMVVGLLAILKAGGAYVPLEPDYPAQRLAFICQQAKIKQLLTQPQWLQQVPDCVTQPTCLDDALFARIADLPSDLPSDLSTTNPNAKSHANQLAYVIFTSGSTGQPKGVMIEHQALVNRINWMQSRYCLTSQDRVLQKTPFSFDVSVWEFLWPLSVGASLVIARPDGHKDPQYLRELIEQQAITTLHFVPSMLSTYLHVNQTAWPPSVRQLFCSGEPLSKSVVDTCLAVSLGKGGQKEAKTLALHNLYGPTEAAIDVSYFDCAQLNEHQQPPIGKPIDNIQLLVLDVNLKPVPMGAPGELHIGGDGLARGYLAREDLTAAAFIDNPFYQPQSDSLSEKGSKRLYKTGDLVRYLPDGNLAYLGRIDNQVKIHGFRIELGEIEAALMNVEGVSETVVVAGEVAGQAQLVAYVAYLEGAGIENAVSQEEQLKQSLQSSLPQYMVPKHYVMLPKLPLTANGKVDKKALPAVDVLATDLPYVEPQTPQESVLVEICGSLLQLDPDSISTQANFFALGGHSLLVIKLVRAVQRQGWRLSAQSIFSADTVAMLAKCMVSADQQPGFIAPANLIGENTKHITPQMLPLVDLTQPQIDGICAKMPGGTNNIQDIYPLIPLQQGMLYHHVYSPEHDPYVLTAQLEIRDSQALDKLTAGLNHIISRHDALRTAFVWQDLPEPVQVVQKSVSLNIDWLTVAAHMDPLTVLSLSPQPCFDLAQAPLVKLCAVKSHEQHYYLKLHLHHLVDDHTSISLIQAELMAWFTEQADLLPPSVPYRQAVAHIQAHQASHDSALFFQQMLGAIESPVLMFDVVDINEQHVSGGEKSTVLADDISGHIRDWSKTHQYSPAVFFHAVWSLVVSACANTQEVVFGTVMSGRMQAIDQADNIVGLLINTLPLSVSLGKDSAATLVAQVAERLAQLIEYEYIPLTFARQCSGIEGDAPLFNSVFNYRLLQDLPNEAAEHGLALMGIDETTNFAFSLSVDDLGQGFNLGLNVPGSVDVNRVMDYVTTAATVLLAALRYTPNMPVSGLSVLPDSEKQQLQQLNDTQMAYPGALCLHHLFEQQALKNPQAIAVVYAAQQQVSFEQLNKLANQWAHCLIENYGVEPDMPVGLCVERGIHMVVALLAILKAGGAYVPLAIDAPAQRLAHIVADAGITVVLSVQSLADNLKPVLSENGELVLLDSDLSQNFSNDNPILAQLTSSHLAYVIYTSGSTGLPKGVCQQHKTLVNLVHSTALDGLDEGLKTLQFTPMTFDVATQEFATSWFTGAPMVLISQAQKDDLVNFQLLLNEQGIQRLFIPPAVFELLIEQLQQARMTLPQLRQIIVAGDVLRLPSGYSEFSKQHSSCRVYNHYGPTETHAVTTKRVGTALEGAVIKGAVPIGKAVSNTVLHVLNSHYQPVPFGANGQLYVSGDGVARGYLAQPELTDEQFINNPWITNGPKIYRTGDVVRYLPDGDLMFVGRIDDQVKIRGFRIELGEIERQLNLCDGVESSLVLFIAGDSGDKQLVAYVQTKVGASLEKLQIKQALAAVLPDYMLPSVIELISHWPLTANGKIDKKALPAPDAALLEVQYVAPKSDSEKALVSIWSSLLGIEAGKISTDANFFALGGHSILLLKCHSRIIEHFVLDSAVLSLKELIQQATIGAMALKIDEIVRQSRLAALKEQDWADMDEGEI